jgi:murein DD-endopeptidase MepM/ murein hydrolase activator NlpD
MRIRLSTAFELGFASGMAVLAALLWAGGVLRPAGVAARSAEVSKVIAARSGEAAKVADQSKGIGMPVAGVDPMKLVSNFADARSGHMHEALDIMAPRGTPVVAAAHGKIEKLFTSTRGGLTVYEFNDAGDLCYYYAHLDHYADGLKEGATVNRGDLLGYVGSTGNASANAPHLHFAVTKLGSDRKWWKGTAVDPLPMLQGK